MGQTLVMQAGAFACFTKLGGHDHCLDVAEGPVLHESSQEEHQLLTSTLRCHFQTAESSEKHPACGIGCEIPVLYLP